ncbi:hypothetical protein [Nocardia sp. NPDC058480]|uniref:hypothetical protein n=1 Tax=Nocardia sp. NPDC058480 TaxID=3346522 RepID=UPI00364C65FE
MVRVDPEKYYGAASALFGIVTDMSFAVNQVLVPGISGTFGMGGGYPAVSGWNAKYATHADELAATAVAYVGAVQQLGDMVNMAGYNWEVANYNANPGPKKGTQPEKPKLTAGSPFGPNGIAEAPRPSSTAASSSGLSVWPSTAGDKIRELLVASGATPPYGDTSTLNKAASGWVKFSEYGAVADGPTKLQTIADNFSDIDAGDVAYIVDLINVMKAGASAVIAASAGMGNATRGHHDELISLRTLIVETAPTVFADAGGATAKSGNCGVSVMPTTAPDAQQQEAASTAFVGIITSHSLMSLLAAAKFDGMEGMSIKSRLESIAALSDDSAIKVASWKEEPKRCVRKDQNQKALDPLVQQWVDASVKYGNEAGIDPQLVMTIVLNEGGYRSDTPIEKWASDRYDAARAGTNDLRSNSIGLTNMKKETFEKLKSEYPAEFGNRNWGELAGDNELAIKAAAYSLKRVDANYASGMTDELRGQMTHSQFMALGYNAESYLDDYVQAGKVGDAGRKYIGMTDERYPVAQQLLGGTYSCS